MAVTGTWVTDGRRYPAFDMRGGCTPAEKVAIKLATGMRWERWLARVRKHGLDDHAAASGLCVLAIMGSRRCAPAEAAAEFLAHSWELHVDGTP